MKTECYMKAAQRPEWHYGVALFCEAPASLSVVSPSSPISHVKPCFRKARQGHGNAWGKTVTNTSEYPNPQDDTLDAGVDIGLSVAVPIKAITIRAAAPGGAMSQELPRSLSGVSTP